MKFNRIVIFLLVLLIALSSCFSQDAKKIRQQIVGVWIAEKNSGNQYVFLSNGDCSHFLDASTVVKYKYSVTNDPTECDRKIKKAARDSTAYIRLYNTRDKSTTCFVINGISKENLALQPYGRGGHLLYIRQNKK
jgi:hypothetical protein